MANRQIPQLPPVIALAGPEELELVQAGTSSRASISQIFDYFESLPSQQLTFNSPLQRAGNIVSLGIVPVSLGGTGATTFPANGVLLGNGTNPVTAVAAGATGTILTGNTGGAPTWRTTATTVTTSFSAGSTGFAPSTATTGAVTLSGILQIDNGGTGSNLQATGGVSQVLRQTTVGGNVSVGQLATTDISGFTAALAAYLPLTGGTLSGPGNLTVNGAAVMNANATVKNTLTVLGPAGVNSGIVRHDDTNMTIRPANAGSILQLGASGSTFAQITSAGHFAPQTTNTSTLGTSALRWNTLYTSLVSFVGSTSGTVTVTPPAVAGTTAISWPAANGVVALVSDVTSAVSDYLPLTGGVLSGPGTLTGTTASFSGLVTALTPPTVDSSTKVATTAWVAAQGFTGGTGAYVRIIGDTMTGPLVGTTSTWSGLSTASGFVSSVDTSTYALEAGRFSAGVGRAVINTRGNYGFEFQVNDINALQLDVALAAFSGGVTGTTATMSSNIATTGGYVLVDRSGDAISAQLLVRSDAAQTATLHFQTGGNSRWALFKSNTAESGTNAGSDFQVFAYNDAGAPLSTPLLIQRTTGYASFGTSALPAARLHVVGSDQTAANFDPAGAQGSTIYLQGNGSAVGTGGAVMFGDTFGSFAAIKGYALSGTGPTGDLVISLRRAGADSAFTEAARFLGTGATTLAGALTGTTARFSGSLSSNWATTPPIAWAAVIRGGVNRVLEIRPGNLVPAAVMINAVNDLQAALVPLEIGGSQITVAAPLFGTAAITAMSSTAIPAGGTSGAGYLMSSTADFGINFGSGVPDKAMARGSWYMRSDATVNAAHYVNVDGTAAGWQPVGGGGVPAGAIMDFAGATAPLGWLFCQGQSVLVATYPDLFAAISYTYGGAGANFNLPDLGGRVTAGKETTVGGSRLTAAGAGIVGSTLGAAGGVQTHTLTLAQSPSHSHTVATGGHSHTISTGSHGHVVNPGYSTMLANAGNPWDFTVVAGTTGQSGYTGYTTAGTDTAGDLGGGTSAAGDLGGSTNSQGSGTTHQNTQPTIVLNKIIKT